MSDDYKSVPFKLTSTMTCMRHEEYEALMRGIMETRLKLSAAESRATTAEARVRELEAQRDTLLEAAKEVEWKGARVNGWNACPCCGGGKAYASDNHRVNCKLRDALALVPETPTKGASQ